MTRGGVLPAEDAVERIDRISANTGAPCEHGACANQAPARDMAGAAPLLDQGDSWFT